jgi:hypothetical protein
VDRSSEEQKLSKELIVVSGKTTTHGMCIPIPFAYGSSTRHYVTRCTNCVNLSRCSRLSTTSRLEKSTRESMKTAHRLAARHPTPAHRFQGHRETARSACPDQLSVSMDSHLTESHTAPSRIDAQSSTVGFYHKGFCGESFKRLSSQCRT